MCVISNCLIAFCTQLLCPYFQLQNQTRFSFRQLKFTNLLPIQEVINKFADTYKIQVYYESCYCFSEKHLVCLIFASIVHKKSYGRRTYFQIKSENHTNDRPAWSFPFYNNKSCDYSLKKLTGQWHAFHTTHKLPVFRP